MRIVVTGREGQVAGSLCERGSAIGHQLVALGRPILDLAGKPEDIIHAIADAQPDVIVSAAAYTSVDEAEREHALARSINVAGAAAVAGAAELLEVPLIHLSTDYVFDGTKQGPYVETDPTNPINVYGETKRDGEEAVLALHDDVAIVRLAWVYSPFGRNFVKSMLRLAEAREEVEVVSDQIGNPSSALDIADALLSVASNLCRSDDPAFRGNFHLAAPGTASWAEFAETIFAASGAIGGPNAKVRSIESGDYPTAARRPVNSCLDSGKIFEAHGVRLPDWKISTAEVVARILDPARRHREIVQS